MVRHIGATLSQFTPSLNLDFTKGIMPGGLTFARNSVATRVNASGVLETVAANTARIDYDPVTLQCRGLLIEESRANLLQNSVSPDAWNKGTNTIKTVNAATAPDGSIVPSFTNTASQNSTLGFWLAVAMQNSTTYTRSLYIKCLSASNAANKRWFFETNLGSSGYATTTFNLADLTVTTGITGVTARIVNAGNGWYRLIQTFTTDTSGSMNATQNYMTGYGSSPDVATFAVWGAQLEPGTFATSIIPTPAASVTRSADICSISTSGWMNQNEGTFVAEFRGGRASNQDYRGCVISSNNALSAFLGGGGPNAIETWNGTTAATLTNTVDYTSQYTRAAMSYNERTKKRTLVAQGLTGVVSALNYDYTGTYSTSSLLIGVRQSGNQGLNGHIRRLNYFPRVLPSPFIQSVIQ